jgi:hypothetical protein
MFYITFFILIIFFLNLIFTKSNLKNSIIGLISSFFYLIPIQLISKNLKKNKKITVNFSLLQVKKWGDYTMKKQKNNNMEYKIIILTTLLYIFLIKNSYSKDKINYSLKYHFLHSLLILTLETPLIMLYTILRKKLHLNLPFKKLVEIFTSSLLIFNYLLIFYCLIHAINNIFVKLPIITDSCKIHPFMDKK